MKKINWRYAFGEILIVIIGISIAFSINKCAENSKNEFNKKQYLSNIKNDVIADRDALQENAIALEQKIKTADEILPKLNTDSPDKMMIVGKIFSLMDLKDFTPKDNTYQTLINSGDLQLINDFELKTTIEKHYSYYGIMMKSYMRLENIQKEYVGNYFIHHTDFDDFKNNRFGFKDEKLLKNIILSMKGSFDLKLKSTHQGVQNCDELILLLNKKMPR